MKKTILCILFSLVFYSVKSQNYTKEQTIEYIKNKLKIADPVYERFDIGDNGETIISWVNDGFWTEYRFNIREIEFQTSVNELGDNIVTMACNSSELNNCIQRTSREDITKVGKRVHFKGYKNIEISSIGGYNNVLSIKNALVYLKVLSISDNLNKTSAKRDPFLN